MILWKPPLASSLLFLLTLKCLIRYMPYPAGLTPSETTVVLSVVLRVVFDLNRDVLEPTLLKQIFVGIIPGLVIPQLNAYNLVFFLRFREMNYERCVHVTSFRQFVTKPFMVDTHSNCSIWPHHLVLDKSRQPPLFMHALNLSCIESYGQITLTLSLNLQS